MADINSAQQAAIRDTQQVPDGSGVIGNSMESGKGGTDINVSEGLDRKIPGIATVVAPLVNIANSQVINTLKGGELGTGILDASVTRSSLASLDTSQKRGRG